MPLITKIIRPDEFTAQRISYLILKFLSDTSIDIPTHSSEGSDARLHAARTGSLVQSGHSRNRGCF